MARAFNLTAELNLRGPSNVRLIVADIRRQLGNITADVDVRVNPATARNLGALNNGLTRLNQTLSQTQNSANSVTTAFTNMARAIGTFNTNVNNVQRNAQNAANACTNLNTNLNQLNRNTRQAANEFEEFGRQSALAVRRFAAFATVTGLIYKFTNAISSASKEFIDFNKELVRVSQVTDTALKDLTPLVSQITRLSSGLGVASQDLIQVSSTLAQAGLSARDTEKALKALALSALAPSFDSLNDTVEGSIALMRQFGIGAGDLEDALGSVNAVAAKFAVEAGDLITAIQRTGGVFATASRGVSEGKDALNEFLAVFTSIRQTTRESAETIATGLRTIFTRIQRKDTIEALQQFGVTLTDLEGKFVGPYEAVRRLSEGLSRLDPRDLRFSEIVEELGGFRQIGKVIPLIQQFAVAQEALKVAQQGQGSLARDAATAQQSVANQIIKVREEFNALIRSIGQSDSFQTFVKLSLDLASALIKLADSAKSVLPALTAIAAIRGASAIGSFVTGFAGGLRRQHFGGPVRGFATGGYVPGIGNSDTVPAMLTPGEFVIRKKAVETLGVSQLNRLNNRTQKFKDGGLAVLQTDDAKYGGLFAQPPQANDQDPGSKVYSISQSKLKQKALPDGSEIIAATGRPSQFFMSSATETDFTGRARKALGSSVTALARQFGIPKRNTEGLYDKLVSKIGVEDIAGKMFEGLLSYVSNQFAGAKNASFDFPLGTDIQSLNSLFGPLPGERDYDAKLTANKDNIQSLMQKAISGGHYTATKIDGVAGDNLSIPDASLKGAGITTRLDSLRLIRDRIRDLNLEDGESIVRGLTRRIQTLAKKGPNATVVPKAKKAAGGGISGEDTVPALLTPGEYVINKDAASRIGLSNLNKLNQADKLQGFNRGGPVGGIARFSVGGPVGSTYQLAKRLMDQGVALADAVARARAAVDRANERSARAGTNSYVPLAQAGNLPPAQDPAVVQQNQANRLARRASARGLNINNIQTPAQTPATGSFASFNANANLIQQQIANAPPAPQQAAARGGLLSRLGIGGGSSLNAIGVPRTSGLRGLAPSLTRMIGSGMRNIGSGPMGMIATMMGGTAIEGIANSLGGEATTSGRRMKYGGSAALNYGATGAMIGSMFGPVGTAVGGVVGALGGLVVGLNQASDAGKAYAQAQLDSKAQIESEKSAKAVETYATGPKTAASRAAAFSALNTAGQAEDAAMMNKQKERVGFWGKTANVLTFGAAGYRDQTTAELAESNMKGQEAGANQAKQLMATEMTRTGKTFAELSKVMKPDEFKMLANNIAQADKNYIYFQTQRAQEIQRLKDEGRNEEAKKLEQQTVTEQAAMAEAIAARTMKEQDAAVMADRAAKANAALGLALEKATMTLEKAFGTMDQVLNKFDLTLEETAKSRQQIVTGQASLTGNTFNRDAQVLKNPSAFSAAERQQAIQRSSSLLGDQGNLVGRVSTFNENITNEATRMTSEAKSRGEDSATTANNLERTLIKRIQETFGADTSLGRTLSENVRQVIKKKLEDAQEKGEQIDFDELVQSALGPVAKASEQANELLIKANEKLAKSLEELGATAQSIADLQQKQIDRTASLNEMQAGSRMSQKEALGMRVTLGERIGARMSSIGDRVGLRGDQVNAQNLTDRKTQLEQEQKRLQARQGTLEQSNTPAAQRELFNLQQRLAAVNSQLANTDKELENLPQSLEGAISDITSEMGKRVADLESRKEAKGNFAEKLVTSTPQELQELNKTFALLTNTINGNITTIHNSQAAQQAYVTALQQGKTQQEAMADAQVAFANQNKNALSMFNELTQMAGVKGPQFDKMRADLLENFAKGQGAGLDRNPMFTKILEELRKDPAQRAAEDPILQALQVEAERLRAEQKAAVEKMNNMNQTQIQLLQATGAKLVQDINNAKLEVQVAVQNIANQGGQQIPVARRAKGGIIYASNGTLVRGTDTVPAMLTPGEFVVNAASTRSNLPLLQSINRSKGGSVRYFANGGLNDISGIGARTAVSQQVNSAKENNILQNNILSGVRNLGQQSSSIKSDTSYTSNNQLPSLSDVTYESKDINAKNFGYLIKLVESIFEFTKGLPSFMQDMLGSVGNLTNMSNKITSLSLASNALLMDEQLQAGNLGNLPRGAQRGIGAAADLFKGQLGDLFDNMFSKGGVVYASKGQLINFEPKGTDTVPAMLTPGEFVVNAKATRENLPLLRAINKGAKGYSRGGVAYLQRGGQPDPAADPQGAADAQANNELRDMLNQLDDEERRVYSDEFRQYYSRMSPHQEAIDRGVPLWVVLRERQIYPEVVKQTRALYFAKLKAARAEYVASQKQRRQLAQQKEPPNADQIKLESPQQVANRVAMARVEELENDPNNPLGFINMSINRQNQRGMAAVAGRAKDRNGNPIGQDQFWQHQGGVPVGMEPQRRAQGGVIYASKGSLINFMSRGTDTVPAMLTPGEFVVNRRAAQKHMGLLQGINSGQYSRGGQVSYLSQGTQGTDMFEASMLSLTKIIETGAQQLNTAFLEATKRLNGISGPNALAQTQTQSNGVSNNTIANIDILGSRLDRFIEQLQAALPPIIKVEGQHEVNVVINGASALQNLLQGPLASLINNAIQSAFNKKSRDNEGN